MSDDISDMLSQGDIDSLLQGVDGGGSGPAILFKHTGERYADDANVKVNICDFRNPVFMTETEMRQVRIRHESFIHYTAARLSMFIRMDVGMKMTALHTMSYEEFTENIPSPTFINLFRIEPLTGVGVISMNPRLSMTLVNRMLGGKGHSITDERYLTDIEMALVEDAAKVVLDEWCNQWEEMDGLKSSLCGRETNGRFLQTSAHDAIMLVLEMECTVGDCSEAIQIGVPYHMIDPLIKQMKERNKAIGDAAGGEEKKGKWLPSYEGINVPVTAEWDAFKLQVSDVLRLREGDVIELSSDMIADTKVRVRGSTKFIGEVGVDAGKVAVKINKALEEDA